MPSERHPSVPLTVRSIRAVGIEVPMTYALGTSRGAITRAPLLLIDLEDPMLRLCCGQNPWD